MLFVKKDMQISKINLEENTQSRVEINQNTVDEYAADLKEGAKFPPVVLFHDGKNFLIGDGWHRLLAFKKAGKKNIEAEIKVGGERDAVLIQSVPIQRTACSVRMRTKEMP